VLIMEQKARKNAQNKQEKHSMQKTWPFYIAIILLFIIYIIVQKYEMAAIATGAVLFLLIIILIVLEFMNGVREEGYARNIVEVVIAIIVVVIIWLALEFALHTSTPLNVVPSCSMLPYLHRGDMIAIYGLNSASMLNAPVINMSMQEFESMNRSMDSEFLSCVAYKNTPQGTVVSQYLSSNSSIGLYDSALNRVISQNDQTGLVRYTCGIRNVTFNNGTTMQEAYTTAITVLGTTIIGDMNNSVVVYKTIPQDSFYQEGDSYIVHRVYAVINASGNYYIMTKGDNNPGLDMQYGNYLIPFKDIEGKVIASVPYIGYLKLILSNSFSQPTGCNFVTQH